MSQKTKQEYLEAAANARQASNAALPELASASAAFESASSARSVLQQNLQNATDFQTKQELSLALKQFDNTVFNPAKTALEVASSRVSLPRQQESQLIRQANSAASAPENSKNIPQPANSNPGDATQYNNISQYQYGSGVTGPTNVTEQQVTNQQSTIVTNNSASLVTTPDQTQPETILITKTLDEPQAPTSEPVENTAGVQIFAVRPQATLPTITIPDESSIVRISNPTAEQNAFIEANSAVVQPQQTIAQTISSTSNPIRQAQKTAEPYVQPASSDTRVQSETAIDSGYPASGAILSEDGTQTVTGIRRNLETGETYSVDTNNQSATQRQRTTDLRFRISLAPDANYMYKIATPEDVLYPLNKTNGVIFPYTPQITLNYAANYDPTDVTHSNYRLFNYRSSGVENISIIADFTAQDTTEANYLLAVMHFFKSVTKMFYGNDENPSNGAPPPLCYLTGFGKYAFNMHAVAITTFSFTYPNDVDYINAGVGTIQGQQLTDYTRALANQPSFLNRISALKRSGLGQGGVTSRVPFTTVQNYDNITRVPTKITLTLSAIPVVTRNNVSNVFSLKDYSTGKLMQRGFW